MVEIDKNIIDAIKYQFDDEKERNMNLNIYKKGMNAKLGDEIDVNDFAICKIVKKSDSIAYLVLEEDGSVRWYINPNDRSDTVLRQAYVVKTGER